MATQQMILTVEPAPKKVREYEFSYALPTGKMRFRALDLGLEWQFYKFSGQWEFLGSDRAGHLRVKCYLHVTQDANGLSGAAFVPGSTVPVASPTEAIDVSHPAHDHSQCQIVTQEPFPQGNDTHWRLCYARDLAQKSADIAYWRLRDERTGRLWLVHDYKGIVNVNWLDGGSHIFVDMPAYVDDAGVAWFGVDPSVELKHN